MEFPVGQHANLKRRVEKMRQPAKASDRVVVAIVVNMQIFSQVVIPPITTTNSHYHQVRISLLMLLRTNEHVLFEVHRDLLRSLDGKRLKFIGDQTIRLQAANRLVLASVKRCRQSANVERVQSSYSKVILVTYA